MIGAVMDRIDRYLGRGRHSIAVPVMDGPLHPNNRLEEAKAVFNAPDLDNLIALDGQVWFSSGPRLMHLSGDAAEPDLVVKLDASITCLAASQAGALAIGLDGVGLLLRGGAHDDKRIETLQGQALICPTAAVFDGEDTLIVTLGTKDTRHADWKRDLMAFGKTGSVWRIDLVTGKGTPLAQGLAYPYGVCLTESGIAVSEAWAYRVVLIEDGKVRPVLTDLPGYPSRLIPAPQGGYALAVFAPRNQLVEFVLREPEFLQAMTTQVHPDYWIAPKLMWGEGFKEPMQGAALKTMGIIKPWAPTWSYGLVIVLDDAFQPVEAFHSRADGSRHGVTSLCTHAGRIVAGAKGAGVAVALAPAGGDA